MAAMILAAKEGLLSEDSLIRAGELYTSVNIFKPEHKGVLDRLSALPASCAESAGYLEKDADFYKRDGVFPQGTIESIISKLSAYDDQSLSERLFNKTDETEKLVEQYIHCM
jgi:glutamine synthetase